MSDRNANASQEDFLRAAQHLVSPDGDRFKLGMMLDYATLLGAVAEAVGRDNVLAYPFERQHEDPDATYRQLASFTGATLAGADRPGDADTDRANVRSLGEDSWSIRPLAPGLRLLPYRVAKATGLPHRVRRPRPFRARSFALRPEVSRLVLDAYAPSNRRLGRDFGLDVAGYGYV